MRGLARFALVVVALALTAAVAAPTLVAHDGHDGATVAKKKKKRKFRVDAEAEVDHGMGRSDVELEARIRDAMRRAKPPVEDATVKGELTELPADGSAHASGVIVGSDSAKTNAQGKASLTFTIDSYGLKQVKLTVTKKGYKKKTKTFTFEVGPDEGPLAR